MLNLVAPFKLYFPLAVTSFLIFNFFSSYKNYAMGLYLPFL